MHQASELTGVETTANPDGTINRKDVTVGHRAEVGKPSPAPSGAPLERAKVSAIQSDKVSADAAKTEPPPTWPWWTIGVLVVIAFVGLLRLCRR